MLSCLQEGCLSISRGACKGPGSISEPSSDLLVSHMVELVYS